MTRPAHSSVPKDQLPAPRTEGSGAVLSGVPEIEDETPMAALADDPGRLPPPRPASSRAMAFVRNYSLPVLLVASFALYGTWSKTSTVFLSTDNLRNMAAGQAVLGVLTLGILLTMVSGHFDLSIGNIAGLSSIVTAALFSHQHVPLIVGVVAGVLVGAAVGGLNGVLVTVLRVDPFIITLGTASVILGYIDWYTHGQSIINGIPTSLVTFGGTNLLGVPKVVYVLGLVALLVYYLLEHTPYGRSLHAIGSNKAAARLVGIRVERTIVTAFATTGAFAGVAGVLLLARTGAGNPQIGTTFTLSAVAAAFLGAASFKVGRLNVPGTIVAIFFLAVNITGLTFAGVQNWINELFTGLTLVLAIALAAVLSKERKTRKAAS